MSSGKLRAKEKRYEQLKDRVRQAEDDGDLAAALDLYHELGALSHWFVEERGDDSKKPVLAVCRRRVPELESILEDVRQRDLTDTSDEELVTEDEADVEEDDSRDYQGSGTGSEGVGSGDSLYELVDVDHDFSDVGGMDEIKEQIDKKIRKPVENPDQVDRLGLSSVTGINLFGPPGTGKTYILKATANEIDASFLYVRGSNIGSKYVNEPEENVRKLFETAREHQPCIIFLDEADSVLAERGGIRNPTGHDQMVSEFLSRVSDVDDEDIVIVAATNKPEKLDEAAERRFPEQIYVGLPDVQARFEVLVQQLKDRVTGQGVSEGFLKRLAVNTETFSCADLEILVDNAAYRALYDGRDFISKEDLKHGLQETGSSVDLERWKSYEEEYND